MTDLETRLQDIAAIRTMMERSTKVLSLSGLSGVSAGTIALAGAAIAEMTARNAGGSLLVPGFRGTDLVVPLGIEGACVLLAAVLATVFFSRRAARKRDLLFWSPAAARVLVALGIPLGAGGLFCLLLALKGGALWIAPAMLLFYGVALVSASPYLVPEVRYLGLAELVVGLLAAAVPAFGLAWWALGFGLLHIVYGALAYWKYGV